MANYKANTLYLTANQYRKFPTEEDKIEKIDITDTFWKEIQYMVKHHEIIIININAKMRLGKSTFAMAVGQEIFNLLKQDKQRPQNENFGIKNICRDEQEHSKIMRNNNTKNTVMVIDESNALEQTGENVTAETALKKVFSDVQAGRYIHAVYCSPKETTDDNADIQLNIVSVNKRKQTTRAKLYYRFNEGGLNYTQLLGYIDISVKEVLNKPWYKEYEKRKYEKMELITKHGIMRPRILDYAKIISQTVKELKELTSYSTMINHNIIRNFIKQGFRDNKIPTSMLGEKLATDEAQGILDTYKALYKIIKQKETTRQKQIKDPGQHTLYTVQIHNLEQMEKKIRKAIQLQEQEMELYQKINEEYHGQADETKDA